MRGIKPIKSLTNLEMPRNDPSLLVVTGGVASQLQDLSGEVFHHGGEVDRGTGTDPLGVVTLAEKPNIAR